MTHKPRTLLWQIGLGLLGAQALAVLLLGWYAVAQLEAFSRRQTVAELERATPLLAQRYVDLLGAGGPTAALDTIVENDARDTGFGVTVILPDGTTIADSDAGRLAVGNHHARPEVAAALGGVQGSDVRRDATSNQQTTYLAWPVIRQGNLVAVVRTALPWDVASHEPVRMVRIVVLAAIASLGLTLLLFYFVSRRLRRSVQRLSDGAARFAGGDLSHRIARPASRELTALTEALNNMAERLADQIDLLQAQRSEQQAIHQSMSNALIALDLEQRILSANRAAERLLGIDSASVRGRLLQEVLREPELHRFVAEAFTDGQSVGEFQLSNGSAPRVQAVSEPLQNAREQLVGLLVLMTDVTELRRLETIRSDFAANVSHELRTPITSIKGYVETMLDVGVRDEAQTRRFLEIIGRSVARLASIVEDLLALARLEQPGTRSTLDKQWATVQRVTESAVAQFEDDAQAKNMTLVRRVPADLRMLVNVQLIEQALGNLISNAVKYSPTRTTVTVGAEANAKGDVVIRVKDQGPGIPPEHLTRIFERFYRVDRARSRELGGTGLGLSIVKHIALVHGGSATVESKVGHGSTFTLTLPGA